MTSNYQNPDSTYGNEWGWPPVTILKPLTGATVKLPASARHVLIKPAGTIAALTVQLPISPEPDAWVDVTFTATVTTLTIKDGGGNTLSGMATSGAANTGTVLRWIVDGGVGAWVRWR